MEPSTVMPCQELVELVTGYLDGALSPADRERFEAHRRTCPGCRTYLAQMQLVVGSLRQLGRGEVAENRAERDRLLDLFRTRGFHNRGPRERRVPLGNPVANSRVLAGLERRGVTPNELERRDRLHTVSGQRPADAMPREIGDRVRIAVDREVPMVRVLGNLGWEHPGWLAEGDILRLEARVMDAIRNLPSVVMCAYGVRGLSGRSLLLGGFDATR